MEHDGAAQPPLDARMASEPSDEARRRRGSVVQALSLRIQEFQSVGGNVDRP